MSTNQVSTNEKITSAITSPASQGYFAPSAYNNIDKTTYDAVKNIVQNKGLYNEAKYVRADGTYDTYAMLDRMGFEGGRMLEPSMGTGNFFGMLPQELANNTQLYGVEYDPLTGQIAQQLYTNAKIEVSPFQDVKLTDNTFDLAIGNVPFLNVGFKYKKGSYPFTTTFS